jgi:serine/threonine protein kinase
MSSDSLPPQGHDETLVRHPRGDAGGPPSDAEHTLQRPADSSPGGLSAPWETSPLPSGPAFGPPARPGDVGILGPYRIVDRLGRGNMGAVYAAIDTRLNRKLALKVMLPEFAADAESRVRFLREARAAAQITHDNVVTVYEADERDGVTYIAMQLLEGYSLQEYLRKKGSPTIPQIMRIIREAAGGLAAAHKRGLIHRDVKPANLWLEAPNGRVKLLDFGLVKPVEADLKLTQCGTLLGTPAYASPQQAGGEPVDHRTDLFSLGCVLYRMCAGRTPFEGPTATATLTNLVSQEPTPIREIAPQVPEPLAELVHQLLCKAPAGRPKDADEVVRRLRGLMTQPAGARDAAPDPAIHVTAPPRNASVEAVEVARAAPTEKGPAGRAARPPATGLAVGDPPAEPADLADRRLGRTERKKPKSDSDERAPLDRPSRPGRKGSGGKVLWIVGGLAALALLAVGGAIVARALIKGKAKDPDPPATGTPAIGTPANEADPDREAAEWVLSVGGRVKVNGQQAEIRVAADLPKDRLTVPWVGLAGTKATDEDLSRLEGLKGLTFLSLARTKVGDTGLARLEALGSLTYLDVRGTKVTAKGVAKFRAAVPACKVEYDAIEPPGDADLEAAKWVMSRGGAVWVEGGARYLKAPAELPKGRFTLTAATLAGTKTDDAGLAHFEGLRGLRRLELGYTKVTDAGLTHLAEVKGLERLSLYSTAVTDEGLARLEKLQGLTSLDVRKTKVTAKGLAKFHAAVPGCKIAHDGGVIEPKK